MRVNPDAISPKHRQRMSVTRILILLIERLLLTFVIVGRRRLISPLLNFSLNIPHEEKLDLARSSPPPLKKKLWRRRYPEIPQQGRILAYNGIPCSENVLVSAEIY
ncbi:hypothetical protein TNCV_2533551 [Trichonephila clavipes]|nr:hypothetical protein TNCV_2533551 [Trichonephila clavipes]